MSATLSVVIPAKNEARRLPRTLAALASASLARVRLLEVLVVDDGSHDDTGRVASAAADLPCRVLRVEGERGVGVAVRAGMREVRGDYALLCDADGPVPFAAVDELAAALLRGHDVAVGSRRTPGASVVVRQPGHRVLMGKVWGKLARGLVPTGVADTQCGFKLFSRAAANELFLASTCTSFAFHVEVLARARRLGLGVAEVPVTWRDGAESKVRLVSEPARMLADLVALAWRLRREQPASPRVEANVSNGARA